MMSHCCCWLPPRTMPASYDPTRVHVVDIYQPYVVDHVHHTHTQYRYHELVQHRHHYPNTVSHTQDCAEGSVECGCPAPDPCGPDCK